ncbi:hypothetical protein B0A55_06066 [Friedmanniomyces simplex]|uniref:Uncharacterized protein n=1 Tax=Friedmanniomyces simplex TaxID=329884 RepID=A0A4U0X9J7_9PEZI|nr:hypothetical protein B0A55_06066 [Friedmanniomyces simplex]
MHLARTMQLLAIMAATTVASPIRMPPGTVIIPPGMSVSETARPPQLTINIDLHLPNGTVILPESNKVLPVVPVYGLDAESLPHIDAVEGALGAGSSDAK